MLEGVYLIRISRLLFEMNLLEIPYLACLCEHVVCFFVGCVVEVTGLMFEGISEENERRLRPGFMARVVWGQPLHVGLCAVIVKQNLMGGFVMGNCKLIHGNSKLQG
jgi:hypothetical protein